MEFCESGSLYEVINNPKVIYTVTTVVTWTSQLFEALNYLKGKHIVHRDLKPHNIFLTKNFVLKLEPSSREYTKTIQGVDTFDQSAFWLDVVMKTRTGTGPTPPECVRIFNNLLLSVPDSNMKIDSHYDGSHKRFEDVFGRSFVDESLDFPSIPDELTTGYCAIR
ncbi:unnamed protein product, partial [Mesorhabditis belari]|uniref:non-specific serine/threonine protein kinase n=1 Tax=Mesorhabditis belari TaxID=2138241 RepID=A0AAF3F974_9BILA